ncbi:16S rRNA (guanine(966)-N(2))-methyltransferase RsmD [Acuticoccus mangrovi]|uniref:16S rRNA (Guanine(966)-N(2))-methyltransferase RsmD n=1 Tax=Acuticoccus mangrovi TaxID=2796142 RepID=A0A934MHF7_9HYPH|nr:16S rRNA (guanine(966)-N(2))-methyltransferase RsmD [Acuticoccus mangrovi]
MRIVGGSHRGTSLVAPRGDRTRPTTDRMRETVFNIIAHRHGEALRDGRVLDLFAGSGALGLEALSRGASFALFVETATEARAAIRRNVEALGALGRTRVWRRDATKPGPCPVAPFTLVFCDPPYGHGLGEAALAAVADAGWLAPGAIAVLEERADRLPEEIRGFERLDQRTIGDSAIAIFALVG